LEGIVISSLPSAEALHTVASELTRRCIVVETSTLPIEDKVQARDTVAKKAIALTRSASTNPTAPSSPLPAMRTSSNTTLCSTWSARARSAGAGDILDRDAETARALVLSGTLDHELRHQVHDVVELAGRADG
jgi:hypothetical protein